MFSPYKIIFVVVLLLIVLLLIMGVRTRIFLRNSQALSLVADGFPKKYILNDSSNQPFTYVALGDSSAVGVGAARIEESMTYQIATTEAEKGNKVSVTNLAVTGARLNDVITKQLKLLPDTHVDLLTVAISGNDSTYMTNVGAFDKDLNTLCAALQTKKIGKIVITTTPNYNITPALPYPVRTLVKRHTRRLQEITRTTVAQYPDIQIADLFKEGTLNSDEYASDGFHPNAAGYRKWAAAFQSKL